VDSITTVPLVMTGVTCYGQYHNSATRDRSDVFWTVSQQCCKGYDYALLTPPKNENLKAFFPTFSKSLPCVFISTQSTLAVKSFRVQLIRMPSKRMSLTEAVRNTDSDVPKMNGIALMMAGNMTAMSFSADSTMPCNVQMQHVEQGSKTVL